MHNLVTVMHYLQTFDRANGEVEEGEERHAAIGHESFGLAVGCIGVEPVPVGSKCGEVLEIVGARGLEYAGDKRLLPGLEVQPDELYRPDKVLAFWI